MRVLGETAKISPPGLVREKRVLECRAVDAHEFGFAEAHRSAS